MVAVPASHAVPPLPARRNGIYVHTERLLGAKEVENCWVIKGLVNIADGVTPVVLSPEYFTRSDGLWEVGRCCARDTHQKTINRGFFCELLP